MSDPLAPLTGAAQADALLAFWFGTSAVSAGGPLEGGSPRADWFGKRDAFDREVRERFGALLEALAEAGEAALRCAWVEGPGAGPATRLAFVVACDQLPRNAHRDTPRAFSLDPLGLACARAMVSRGDDARLAPLARWFAYLPFEHSESLADQDEGVRLFGTLVGDPGAGEGLQWALKHREVIARFGRFPHRNAVLGRESTAEEIDFLARPGSRF